VTPDKEPVGKALDLPFANNSLSKIRKPTNKKPNPRQTQMDHKVPCVASGQREGAM
jgi:hypothetical protein